MIKLRGIVTPITLSDVNEVEFKTSLKNSEVVEKLKSMCVGKTPMPWHMIFARKHPKFSGFVENERFELQLLQDSFRNKMPVFLAPIMRGQIKGTKPTTILVEIKYSGYHKLFMKIWSGFAIFWWMCWIFFGLGGFAYGAIQAFTSEKNATFNIDLNSNIGIIATLIAPVVLVPIFFNILPKYLIQHSFHRSSKCLNEVFSSAN